MNELCPPWDAQQTALSLEAARVALWSWNVDDDKFAMDGRGFDLWQLPVAPGVTFEDLSARIHPADRDRVRAAFLSTRSVAGFYETDFRIILDEQKMDFLARARRGSRDARTIHVWRLP